MNPSGTEYADLVKRIKEALDRHDPLGLHAMGAPADEYEAQASAIARAIRRSSSLEECLDVTWNVFYESFGEFAGRRDQFRRLANAIHEVATNH